MAWPRWIAKNGSIATRMANWQSPDHAARKGFSFFKPGGRLGTHSNPGTRTRSCRPVPPKAKPQDQGKTDIALYRSHCRRARAKSRHFRRASGFFDHMLDQLSRHSLIDHDGPGQGRSAYRRPPHRSRDTGHRRLGQALAQGTRRTARHHALCLDRPCHGRGNADARGDRTWSGRPFLVWKRFLLGRRKIRHGSTPKLVREFFQALATECPASRCTSPITYGANNHHIGRDLLPRRWHVRCAQRSGARPRGQPDAVPSTKGFV